MSFPIIDKYRHSCAQYGSDYTIEVEPWEFQYSERCHKCGDYLATERSILAHIYEQLLIE